MQKFVFNLLFFLACALGLVYLLLPAPSFPQKPVDSVQSLEEGDTESPLRRGYVTNLTRAEVIDLYYTQMSQVGNIPLPTIRLNYPPEDAQTLIRDQTRSNYLEEFVHPFRESLFISGYIPDKDIYEIWYRGVKYNQKIVVKYAPSSLPVRVIIFLGTMVLLYVLIIEFSKTVKSLFKEWVLTKYK